MFVWVGAAVDIPYRVHKQLATLGPKLYFFRLPFKEKTDEELVDCLNENFEKKRKQVQDAIIDYLMWFELCPTLIKDEESGLSKIQWNSSKDDPKAKEYLKDLAKLLARVRGHVDIWPSKQHEYSEYSYSYTQTEDPARATKQLYNLARGHALLLGRSHVTEEDIPIAAKVVLSTASIERVAILDLLLAKGGKVTLSKIARALVMSKSTALKAMTELNALKVVDMDDDVIVEGNPTKEIALRPEFAWLLDDHFTKLRDGFVPVDTSGYMDGEEQEEQTKTALKQKIFWERFEELQNKSGDKKVKGQELKDRLVSSNKFFVGDAQLFIEDMMKTGQIEEVGYDTYKRTDSGIP